ncbi:hypothetical protein BLJAPNOD_02956 [Ensifer sp. M14]|nr:hypothetical protein BLJAPNOD_02956 [Ensifer sp. M14]
MSVSQNKGDCDLNKAAQKPVIHRDLSKLSELLAAGRQVAANDNEPQRKKRPYRHRGTLPALRWLFDNHPDLAPALASALPKPDTNWSPDAIDNDQKIRPTIGELLKAASDAFRVYVRDGARHVGAGLAMEMDDDIEHITFGSMKFRDGRLVEWARTKKGHKLGPVDRIAVGESENTHGNPERYLKTKATAQSPMHASSLPRNVSDRPVLPPMFDPQAGVEANRELLRSLGVDGSVKFDDLPITATKCETAVAKGAAFLGGVSRPSGNSSAGAQPWEAPEEAKGEVVEVIEEVAARGTLKSIGLRLGYSENYADRAGKAALVEAARVLAAANDNKKYEANVPNRAGL